MMFHPDKHPAVRRRLTAAVLALSSASMLAGCASTTPAYDLRFGEAVRHNLQAQTLAPAAAPGGPAAAALDASTARSAVQRYRDSFKAPPPVVNVIGIGASP